MSLQLEMVSCGNCARCLAGGKVHGPYWYRYFRRDGAMVSEYVGKEVPSELATEEHPVGSTPEDLYPGLVARMRAEAKRDGDARRAALPRYQGELIDSIVEKNALLRRALRRARKASAVGDAAEEADALEERQRLVHEIASEKSALRESFAQEAELQEEEGGETVGA